MSANDIITTYTYDENGNLTSKSLSNGIATDYAYNNAGLPIDMVNKKGEEIYNSYSLTYTLNGLKKTETQNGVETKSYVTE